MQARLLLTTCLVSVSLSACGSSGGDGSSEIQGLVGPSQVSIITANEEAVNSGGGATVAPGAGTFPVTSPYVTDQASVHVFDPSMDGLRVINEILCILDMTAYPEMVNEDDYKAQYEAQLCEGEQEDNTQGQSNGGVPETRVITVNSVREDNQSPQTVNLWVPNDGDTIYAQGTLTEGASSANPFGVFGMNFASATDFASIGTPKFRGFLRTADAQAGSIGFEFAEEQGDVTLVPPLGERSSSTRVSVEMLPDGTTGAALIREIRRENNGGVDTGQVLSEVKVVFNETHMKTKIGPDPEVTLSRTSFKNAVHRYTLYHNDGVKKGERVELFSGFSFTTEDSFYGWMGYWGLWVQGTQVANGNTIYRSTENGSQGEAYTVIKAPGKLVRNTRSNLALVDLGSTLFEWWDAGTQYRVDYSAGSFRKVASFDPQNETWDDITPPEVIDVTAAGGYLHMHSSSLGGPVSYADGALNITFVQQSFVNGADDLFTGAVGGNVELLGLVDCLGSELTGSEVESGTIFLPNASSPAAPHKYRMNVDTLTMELDVNGDGSLYETVGLATGQFPMSGPYTWGMQSGPMVTDLTGIQNVQDIYEAAEFFTYETGHNEWNQYTAIKDANDVTVAFDAPIEFLYEHSTAADLNDSSDYDGDSFLLQYGGTGDLHGFPHEQVDLNGDGNPDVYQPLVNIKAGVVMGPTGVEYILRPIRVEQTLTLDPGAAPGLNLADADSLVLPEISEFVTPTNGEDPDVQAPPAVINGVVNGTN